MAGSDPVVGGREDEGDKTSDLTSLVEDAGKAGVAGWHPGPVRIPTHLRNPNSQETYSGFPSIKRRPAKNKKAPEQNLGLFGFVI
jgi:hypothetical protein